MLHRPGPQVLAQTERVVRKCTIRGLIDRSSILEVLVPQAETAQTHVVLAEEAHCEFACGCLQVMPHLGAHNLSTSITNPHLPPHYLQQRQGRGIQPSNEPPHNCTIFVSQLKGGRKE